MNNQAAAVAALTGSLALSGCVAPLGKRSVRLGIPVVRQHGGSAGGLAAARMVSRYYGRGLSERAERLMRLASTTEELSSEELALALEASGFRVALSSSALPELYRHLDHGDPVIVRVGGSFMIVAGYVDGHLVLLDPRSGALTPEAADFDRAWSGSDRQALVAVPAARGVFAAEGLARR